MSFVNLRELEQMAKSKVDNMIFEYYRSGGNEEITKDDNINAFKRIHLDPRVLVDVSKINTETTILGHKIAFPIGIAPTAMQKMAHPKGENISALVAKQHNIPFVLSTLSTSTFEEVASHGGLQFFQLYIQKDRSLTEQVVKQAEQNGFKALIVTVDAPVLGKREADERQKFSLPSHLKLQILDSVAQKNNKNLQNVTNQEGSGLMKFFADQLDQSLTWKDISWLRGITKLPIVLKGIQSAEDAILAKENGVDAIWVSNHGGRQLDTVRATIDILPEVVKAVGGSIEIYVDGGVRGGTDVFKCLQLGAKCVFIGRPVLYSMIIDGEKGVDRMLNILEKEFIQTLQLMGRPKL